MLEYFNEFELPIESIMGEGFRPDVWEMALDSVLYEKNHTLSEKLIAILYLCKVAEEQIHPDDYMPCRAGLENAVLGVLKIFESQYTRNLLPTEALKRLLFSIWEKHLIDISPMEFLKESIRIDFLTPDGLKKILLILWEKVLHERLATSYCDSLTIKQLKKRILILWEVGKCDIDTLDGEYLDFYACCKLLKPKSLNLLIYALNVDVDDTFCEKFQSRFF